VHTIWEGSGRVLVDDREYTDVNYFCRDFKKLQGLSPQQYRQQARAIPRLAGRKGKVS